ncbi:MAG TPA: hypothetical protein VMR06_04395 [Dokdonella sp.]|uniref:hypothetical protein n=1 Tax=Dokdonella sp. TaxID=2291710 RepID=UPI002C2F288F|nr:hypothetical protein [Dokdonella sp.]HUD41219.1 hypothetical protein [Dokdonella sp.]
MATRAGLAGVAAAALMIGAMSATPARAADLDCKLRFTLSGWAAVVKHAEGTGTVTCENGQSMQVKIEAKGGGLTVGKYRIDDGRGTFSDVRTINDVLGTYAEGEAQAGAVKSGSAQVLTKGTVSLALAGTGEGVGLGVSVGAFTISRVK